jgi:hypothetical protein
MIGVRLTRFTSSAVLALVLPAAATAQDLPTLSGIVLDFANEAVVAGARVELLGARDRSLASTYADSTGAFSFARVRPGTYRLRAQSLGYRQVVTPEVNVAAEPVEVVVRLAVGAVPLAPLEVVTRAQPQRAHINIELSGFYERSQRKMGGTFIMRDEIDARNPSRVTDLLRTVGSLTVTGDVMVNMRCNNGPPVYLDGILLKHMSSGRRRPGPSSPTSGIDPGAAWDAANSVDPFMLEGIEIYKGPATLPPQFAAFVGACGAILMWSKRGPGLGGDGTRQ